MRAGQPRGASRRNSIDDIASGTTYDLVGVSKTFGDKLAVDDASLHVGPGRVIGIVGENGAGKSTLMNLLGGLLQPDAGGILRDGHEIQLHSPLAAAANGIAMVHQHLRLVPSLSVAENVFLGREPARWGSLQRRAMVTEVQALSERLGIAVDPNASVRTLPIGLQQRVALLKALATPTNVLILDEPTAVLTPQESSELFQTVRSLAKQGTSTILITHKLGELREVADELAVMRDGRLLSQHPIGELDARDIARLMVGRDVLLRIAHDGGHPAGVGLELEGLSVTADDGSVAVDDLSLELRYGEVLGVAGVEGNGQAQLAEAVLGTRKARQGRVLMHGFDVTTHSTLSRRRHGLAAVSEDRNETGTAPTMTVWENLVSPAHGHDMRRWGWLRVSALGAQAEALIARFDIRGATPTTRVRELSGGNAQKVVIAREFEGDPKVLVASQPTRGVDVGAMEFIHRSILDRRDAGAAVLLISADLNEVTSLADRMIVIYRGRVTAKFARGNFDHQAIGLAMAGIEATQESAIEPAATKPETPALGKSTPSVSAMPDRDAASPQPHGRQRTTDASAWARVRRALGPGANVIAAIAAAVAIGAILIAATGGNPISSLAALFGGSFQSPFGVASLLVQLVPLLVLGVSVLLSFRVGLFNVGAEGQLYMGAFTSAWLASSLIELPGPLLVVVAVAAGALGGLVWSVVPALMKAHLGVDEVVTTLMFNYIAMQLTLLLISGPLHDPSAGGPMGMRIDADAFLPGLPGLPGATIAVLIAVLVWVVGALVLLRTRWGLAVRRVGEKAPFATAMGINVPRTVVGVMLLSGAIAGIAGALDVLGNTHRFSQLFSPEYGFLAVTIALLARLNPWMLIVAAFLYTTMLSGANVMQLQEGVPISLVTVLQGVVVICMTMDLVRTKQRRIRRAQATTRVAS